MPSPGLEVTMNWRRVVDSGGGDTDNWKDIQEVKLILFGGSL